MEDGIPPREASDRLNIYQAKFDELYRKYVTYSGGEELFGLTVTEYPDLQVGNTNNASIFFLPATFFFQTYFPRFNVIENT